MRLRFLAPIVALPVILAACGGGGEEPTRAPATPTRITATTTPLGPTPTRQPTTPTTQPTATTPPTAGGDPTRGQAVFTGKGLCASCHTTTNQTLVGPGLGGIATRAGERIKESGYKGKATSALGYILESEEDPAAFIVPGFSNVMPAVFPTLTKQEQDDLIAYLLTLK